MIILRKIYFRIKPKDYGQYKDAIILYEKRAVAYTSRRLSPEEAKLKGHDIESIDTQFNHFLQIDLWLIIIKLRWESKTNIKNNNYSL